MSRRPVAMITAASRGMGAACARTLAQNDYQLAIMARHEDVFSLAEELNAWAMQGSVDNAQDLQTFVEQTRDQFGRIDVVVNNTGHAPKGDLLALTDDQWEAGFDLLLMNVIRMSRLVTPIMQQQGTGSIVNISTFGAVEPSLTYPISSTIRASLGAFARLFSQRYAAQGLRMNNVMPGLIDTYPADEAARAAIPAGRLGTASEVAQLVAYLASEKARYITGQSWLIDGGLVRGL